MSGTVVSEPVQRARQTSWSAAPKYVSLAIMIALLLLLPALAPNRYILGLVVISGIWMMLSLSLNIVVGYTGLISAAHGAILAVGAYTTALLVTRLGVSFWWTVPASAIAAGSIGLVIGYLSLRTRGAYFLITTLAFGMVVHIVVSQWDDLTRGTSGIPGISPPPALLLPLIGQVDFKQISTQYFLILSFVLTTIYIVYRVSRLRLGRSLIAIREDEELAASVGVNAMHYKMLAFVIASCLAGVAGSLYALHMGVVTPEVSGLDVSFNAIVQVLVGGSGTVLGPILGTLLLHFLPQALIMVSWSKDYQMLLYGIAVLATAVLYPTGIMGGLNSLRIHLSRRSGS